MFSVSGQLPLFPGVAERLKPGRRRYDGRVLPPEVLMDRIMRRVTIDPVKGCWLCSYRGPTEYCVVRLGGRRGGKVLVHRFSYEFHIGPVPDGFDVLHDCDVPVCCTI